MKNYKIIFEKNPHPDDIKFLDEKIILEHKRKMNMQSISFFAYFIRDDGNTILGGCAGDSMYGGLYVSQLWVDERLRGQGYGTQLIISIEKYARKTECRFITVNTFGWEALEFYKKNGFEIEFERHGYDKNSIFYFLRKNL